MKIFVEHISFVGFGNIWIIKYGMLFNWIWIIHLWIVDFEKMGVTKNKIFLSATLIKCESCCSTELKKCILELWSLRKVRVKKSILAKTSSGRCWFWLLCQTTFKRIKFIYLCIYRLHACAIIILMKYKCYNFVNNGSELQIFIY